MAAGWIALAGSVLGSSSSKKGAKKANKAANTQAQLAKQLFYETDPTRRALLKRSETFLGVPNAGTTPFIAGPVGGGLSGAIANAVNAVTQPNQSGTPGAESGGNPWFGDVTDTPTYAWMKQSADSRFNQAKDNAIARLPAGGALASKLVDLEGDRASELAQGSAQVYENELARALSLATGQTPVALGSLGQAASVQAMNAQSQAMQSAAKSEAVGSAAGAWAGSGGKSGSRGSGTGGGSGGKT